MANATNVAEREHRGAAAADPHNLDDDTLLEGHVPLSVKSFSLTDTGKVRETNEDQFLISTLVKALQIQQTSFPQANVQHSSDRSHLFIVADDMGGPAAGHSSVLVTSAYLHVAVEDDGKLGNLFQT